MGLMSWRHGSPPSWRRLQIPVGTAFHRRPSPQAAFDSTIAFVTFDELAKCCYTVGEILEKQMTVGELDKLVGEIRQRKGKLLLTIPEKSRSSHQRFFSKVN